jgi:hypothetical protein
MKSRKNLLIIGAVIAVLAFIGNMVAPKNKTSSTITKADTTSATTPDMATTSPEIPISNWQYDSVTDKMTSKQKIFANTVSTNILQFDFPYDGGSTANILLRKQNKKTEVLITISKGQFNTSIIDGASVKVRFDDDPAQNYYVTGPSDGSYDVIFINATSKFINRLKTSSTVKIEAEFFQSGFRVMEFNTSGLKWNQ